MDISMVGWTEKSPDGTKDAQGDVIAQQSPVMLFSDILSVSEEATEQDEISLYTNSFDAGDVLIKYGPQYRDRRVPNCDDCISDAILLDNGASSCLPTFSNQNQPGNNTNCQSTLRVTSNGVILLDDFDNTDSRPLEFGTVNYQKGDGTPVGFVAALWNDHWSLKDGRIYMRLETADDINGPSDPNLWTDVYEMVSQHPDFQQPGAKLGPLKWIFVVTYWQVTYYGADKNAPHNTFQMVLTTDGRHSFFIANFLEVQWSQSNSDMGYAATGFEIRDHNGEAAGSFTDQGVFDFVRTSTNNNVPGRHVFRIEDADIDFDVVPTQPPAPTTADPVTNPPATQDPNNNGTIGPCQVLSPKGQQCVPTQWPQNDPCFAQQAASTDGRGEDPDYVAHCGGCNAGFIGEYAPIEELKNGTCLVVFPAEVELFHVFGGHVRADDAQTGMAWRVTMANPDSDSNGEGYFSYVVHMKQDQIFDPSEVSWTCNTDDEFEYAIYSFPQNLCRKHVTTNIRRKSYFSDFHDVIVIDLGAPVDNFSVMDPRINMTTTDNQHFVLHFPLDDVPRGSGHAHEIHMEWDYRVGQFFLSNTVTVMGYGEDQMTVDAALNLAPTN